MNINRNRFTFFTYSATAVGIILAMIQTSAINADDYDDESILNQTGFYIGGSLGQSSLEPHVTVVGGRVDEDTDAAYKVFAGYEFNDKLAIEAFYADMGAAHIDIGTAQGNVDYELYGVAGVYTQQVTDKVNAIAKVGYGRVNNEVDAGISYRQVESGVVYGGVGIEYELSDNLSLRGEYEYFDKDIQLISAGFSWKF